MAEKFGTNVYAPVVAGNDTSDDMAVAYGDELGRTIHHFLTVSDRDGFSSSFKSRLFHSWCVVKADENGFAQWYEWDGTQEDGSDGKWVELDISGVVMSDSDGAIPKNIKTVVFGPGFAIQQAGDQEDAALVTYTPSGDNHSHESSLTVGQTWGGYGVVDKVTTIDTLYPLEVNQGKSGPNQPSPGSAVLSIKPNAFEGPHSPAFLGKVGSLTLVEGGRDTTVFYNSPITPYGMYFSANEQLQGINIQEDDSLDPNLGGQLTELLVSVGFEGKAQKEGTVKLWLMYHQNGAFLPNGYLTDTRGKPMIVEKAFSAGDDVKLIIDGAYYAQGQETITVHVEHDIADEYLVIEPEESLFCINQYQYETGSSLSRIEFLRRNQTQITPAFFNFSSNFASLKTFVSGSNRPESEVNPGEGESFVSQFGVTNLTKIKGSITNGVLSISDNGSDIADFYVNYLVDNIRTQMMRGREFSVSVRTASINNSFSIGLYKWTGKANEIKPIYSGRVDDSITMSPGWVEVKKVFIPANALGGYKSTNADFVIPDDAVNLSFALIPTMAQLPSSIDIDDFVITPKSPFIGYVPIEKRDLKETHLETSDEYLELGQNSEGYESLRYTINYSPLSGLPMPVGVPLKGNAPFTLDKTKNVISGSQASGGEGALVAGKDGQVSLSCDYLLWNETSADTVVDVWWVLYDVDGNESKISGSEIQFTVPKNSTTHGIPKTQKAFVFEIEKGQAFALRASANKPDGAYIESTKLTDYMVRPVIDFKELVATANDDPELVSAPIPRALAFDRRVYSFTGNTLQNIVIDMDVPADVELAEIEVVKRSGTKLTSIKDCEYAYDSNTKKLTVHVGTGVADGKIYLTFWSGVA